MSAFIIVKRFIWSMTRHLLEITSKHCVLVSLSLHFNGYLPGGHGLSGTGIARFQILLELRVMQMLVATGAIRRAKLQSNHHHQQSNIQFLQIGYPSCRRTNNVGAVKGSVYTVLVSTTGK